MKKGKNKEKRKKLLAYDSPVTRGMLSVLHILTDGAFPSVTGIDEAFRTGKSSQSSLLFS